MVDVKALSVGLDDVTGEAEVGRLGLLVVPIGAAQEQEPR